MSARYFGAKRFLAKHRDYLLLFLITLMGAFFRFNNLGKKSLWFDELAQVTISRTIIHDLSLPQMGFLQGMWWELSPPLDYFITHFMFYFGSSEWILRFPASMFGILSILAIFYLAKEIFGAHVGLISAFLISISPMHIWFSQEVRVYSLFMFLTILSFLFFLKITKKNNIWYWIPLTVTNLALIYTHYFGFFVILIQGIYLLLIFLIKNSNFDTGRFSLQNKRLKALLVCIISNQIVFIFFIPWLDIFRFQTSDFRKPLDYGLEANIEYFNSIMHGFSSFNAPGTSSIILTIIFFLLFILGVLILAKTNHYVGLLFFIWIFLPICLLFIMTLVRGQPSTTIRNFIFILPAVLIIVAIGVTEGAALICKILTPSNRIKSCLKQKPNCITLLFLIGIFLLNVNPLTFQYSIEKANWRGTGQFLSEHTGNTELIVLIRDQANYLRFYYSSNATIISIPDNYDWVSLIPKNNYTKIWFVPSPDFGVNDPRLKEWLNDCWKVENERFAIYSYSPEDSTSIFFNDSWQPS
jgi:mannosyltransferase